MVESVLNLLCTFNELCTCALFGWFMVRFATSTKRRNPDSPSDELIMYHQSPTQGLS